MVADLMIASLYSALACHIAGGFLLVRAAPTIRVVNGPSSLEGRLEIFHENFWGTVCGDGFSDAAAGVACRQLGFASDGAVSFSNAKYGQGTQHIWLDNVNCQGNETSIQACHHPGWGTNNCPHTKDVGIRCKRSIQLADGSLSFEGRLEIFHENVWGTVCDDNFTNAAAEVACRQLGYPSDGAVYFSNARFGLGNNNIWLDNLICLGSETSIQECQHRGWGRNNCHHNGDIGIRCTPTIRVVNGPSYLEGRLEIFHKNIWGTVCDDGFSSVAAEVACRQLGFASYGARSFQSAKYGQGSLNISLDDVSCHGDEASIQDCHHLEWGVNNCGHGEDVGISCTRNIRVVNGSSYLEGRLEVFHENVWGTVCDDDFTNEAAGVACRQLGFASYGAVSFSNAKFGQGNQHIWLDDVTCHGDELSIHDCQHREWGSYNCHHNEDVGIRCKRSIRLVGGLSSLEGRLEIVHDNVWGTVCDGGFTNIAAGIACRELGFASDAAVSLSGATFGQGNQTIWLHDVTCHGNEMSIQSCQHPAWGSNNCSHSEDVGIRCKPSIRLVDGHSFDEGRLEIFHENVWGTVCHDGFTVKAAEVACRQLGFASEGAVYLPNAHFGPGAGTIWLDDVSCRGDEISMQDCQHLVWGSHNCGHYEDVGIRCSGSIRLVDGHSSLEGRLEIFHENVWGTVCHDSFTNNAAEVACRQLGFASEGAVYLPNGHFGPGANSIWLDDLSCRGDEQTIQDCQHFGWRSNNCTHAEDVEIRCKRNIRLVNGPSSHEGRLEVFHENVWGTVCDDGITTDTARVACRSLGFISDGAMFYSNAHYGQGTNRIWLDGVVCRGDEETLAECTHNAWGTNDCQHSEDVGIQCSTSVRLIGGSSSMEGRLEIYHEEQWGTVCGDAFTNMGARVVCRMLGFHGAAVYIPSAFFGAGTGRIWLEQVNCTGSEVSVADCSHNGWGTTDCSHGADVGVVCRP